MGSAAAEVASRIRCQPQPEHQLSLSTLTASGCHGLASPPSQGTLGAVCRIRGEPARRSRSGPAR
jgi:hypothetical protein